MSDPKPNTLTAGPDGNGGNTTSRVAPQGADSSLPSADGDPHRRAFLEQFKPLFAGTGGIDSWLVDQTPYAVIERLERVDGDPLTRSQLNQLLVLSHEAGVSAGFFTYYWLTAPMHTYDVTRLPGYDASYGSQARIASLQQLRWGLHRFYTDALLYFGNIRSAYRRLRDLSEQELNLFFGGCRQDTHALSERGVPLSPRDIPRDDRYLISEMACKSLAPSSGDPDLRIVLRKAYSDRVSVGGDAKVSVKQLLEEVPADQAMQLTFTADEILSDTLDSLAELDAKVNGVAERFESARAAALHNTQLYLSMVEDLDVYVATSMRSRQDFRDMAVFCDVVFGDERLTGLNVRYFDPTMSAADGHEDKGLIECLMVKSAKVLIYVAGERDSYGKDAEVAMALSQGKPVIVYCPKAEKVAFYRDVHPLARLIDFRTGVANGWMVASSPAQVAELLSRTLRNEMVYEIERARSGNLRLKDALTKSVVRLQTNDKLLRETFWNYYHREPQSPIL